MDKETLSNYGWIVICVLVLAVMIALATPFGSFIAGAIKSTTAGLFDVNKNALDAAGVPGLTVQDQEFDVPDMSHGAETPAPVGATFSDGTFLTWDELKLEENGTKYGYDASKLTDTSIVYYAFHFCEGLTSITIPDSVTSIGHNAFTWCTSLTSITIPDSVTSIGDSIVNSCISLTSITFPDSVTSIGYNTFTGCTSLTSITIPDSVTSIGVGAFNGCTKLTSITIPDSLTSIGQDAFWNCPNLTDVYYTGTQEQWNAITIESSDDDLTNATKHYNYTP